MESAYQAFSESLNKTKMLGSALQITIRGMLCIVLHCFGLGEVLYRLCIVLYCLGLLVEQECSKLDGGIIFTAVSESGDGSGLESAYHAFR